MEIRWEEPPASRRQQAEDFSGVIAALKERPNDWARIAEYETPARAGGIAQQIRDGKRVGFTKGQFQASSRTVDGKGVVYARYVG